jgi:hypothetical protein
MLSGGHGDSVSRHDTEGFAELSRSQISTDRSQDGVRQPDEGMGQVLRSDWSEEKNLEKKCGRMEGLKNMTQKQLLYHINVLFLLAK